MNEEKPKKKFNEEEMKRLLENLDSIIPPATTSPEKSVEKEKNDPDFDANLIKRIPVIEKNMDELLVDEDELDEEETRWLSETREWFRSMRETVGEMIRNPENFPQEEREAVADLFRDIDAVFSGELN